MRKFKLTYLAVPIAVILVLLGFPLAASAATPNNTGLTAKTVAHSGQTITGPVDATNFDIGIYIGPGVHDVTVTGAAISGAHDEGILVQDTSGIVIRNSTISNNGLTGSHADPSSGNLTEDKAIVLAGTTNCLVNNNVVEGNGHGGISVLDDGPNHPFALKTVAKTPVPGTKNVITGNDIVDNLGDCGIVVAAKNPPAPAPHHGDKNPGDGIFHIGDVGKNPGDGAFHIGDVGKNPGDGVNDNTISNNRVIADPVAGPPYVGGIVVAGGAFGPVNVNNNVIQNNVVVGGVLPGISIHAFGPGVITGTKLIGNVLSNNGPGEAPGNGKTTGIEIFAVPGVGVIKGTQVQSDTVINDYYGVWHVGDSGTTISGLLPYGVTTVTSP